MKTILTRLWKEESGQDLTEYALLLVLVALFAIASVKVLATAIANVYTTAAAEGIIEMSKQADSESVRLSALRAVLADMMAVSKYSGLEVRITEIKEKLVQRDGAASSNNATWAAPSRAPFPPRCLP